MGYQHLLGPRIACMAVVLWWGDEAWVNKQGGYIYIYIYIYIW